MAPTHAITLTLASFAVWLLAMLAEPTLDLALMVLVVAALSVVIMGGLELWDRLMERR